MPPDEESSVCGFVGFLLRLLQYDVANDHDRIVHTGKEIRLLMRGQIVDTKTDVCISRCLLSLHHHFFLIQEHKVCCRSAQSTVWLPISIEPSFARLSRGTADCKSHRSVLQEQKSSRNAWSYQARVLYLPRNHNDGHHANVLQNSCHRDLAIGCRSWTLPFSPDCRGMLYPRPSGSWHRRRRPELCYEPSVPPPVFRSIQSVS